MQTKQSRGLQAFRRAQAWFAEFPSAISESGSSAPALTNQVNALAAVIARMTEQGTTQAIQKGQATLVAKDETALRSNLRKVHIRAIVHVANALRGQVPGVGVIAMPPSELRSERLVKSAEQLYATASVYKDVFVEHGLPQDFLEQLAAATSALKSSIDARGLALSKRTGATTSLSGEYDLGRRILSMIDASLTHALQSDPALLASWRQAKRATVKAPVARAVSTLSSPAVEGGSTAIAMKPVTLASVPSVPGAASNAVASVPDAVAPNSEPVAPVRIAA